MGGSFIFKSIFFFARKRAYICTSVFIHSVTFKQTSGIIIFLKALLKMACIFGYFREFSWRKKGVSSLIIKVNLFRILLKYHMILSLRNLRFQSHYDMAD